MVMALAFFAIAGVRKFGFPIPLADFRRRRNFWIALTLLAFLAHNIWILLILMFLLVWMYQRTDGNPVALYCVVLLGLPPYGQMIPGFAGLNRLLYVDTYAVAAVALLVPAALAATARMHRPVGAAWPDRLLIAYVAIGFGVALTAVPLTEAVRATLVYPLVYLVLPYYVASRFDWTLERFRDLVTTIAVMCGLLAVIGVFETTRYWLLYDAVDRALALDYWGWGGYLERSGSGRLRAVATTGHSLVLGFMMAFALCLLGYLRYVMLSGRGTASGPGAGPGAAPGAPAPRGEPTRAGRAIDQRADWARIGWVLAIALLVAGLLSSTARGPWLGLLAGIAVLLATSRMPVRRMIIGGIAVAVVLAAVLAFTPGRALLDYVPFVGQQDAYNVTYRSRLFDVSLDVIAQRPLLGDYHFMRNPMLEVMRQGEGIIDIVNSYLEIAMRQGLLSLACFVGIFAWPAWQTFRLLPRLREHHPEAHHLGRALLAALVCVLVTIATVSSILAIAVVPMLLAGLCVGFVGMAQRLLGDPAPRAAAKSRRRG
jgi:hypothetical protein